MTPLRICTPVTGHTLQEFLANLTKIQEISDFIELRTDFIKNLKLTDVMIIKKAVKKDVIFTCRKKEEGGTFTGSEKDRANLLQKAIDLHFQHVDIEFSTAKEHTFICNNHSKIILSYHNLKATPSYWDLNKLIFQMKQNKPDIIKIACFITEEYENTKLYRLLTNKPHNEERIVIGLGEKGRMSKILAPILGSYVTYASTPYAPIERGDIGINKLLDLYHQLNGTNN